MPPISRSGPFPWILAALFGAAWAVAGPTDDVAVDGAAAPSLAPTLSMPEPGPPMAPWIPAPPPPPPPPGPVFDATTSRVLAELAPRVATGDDLAAGRLAAALLTTPGIDGDRARAVGHLTRGVLAHDRAHALAGAPGDQEERQEAIAADAFAAARGIDGPLAAVATWLLADLSADRGHDLIAVEACDDYRARWPDGRFATDCLAVQALSHARRGDAPAAESAASAWTARYRRESLRESVELGLAEHEAARDPEAAIARLRPLTVRFSAAQTGRRAEQLLDGLFRSGHATAVIPDDLASAQARAVSLRETGRLDEAWALVRAIARRTRPDGQPDPAAVAWAEAQYATFAWSTRRWDELEGRYRDRFASRPSSGVAWDAWRAASRGGRYEAARIWMLTGIARWGTQSPWRSSTEAFGRTLLLGGHFDEATAMFDRGASLRTSSGRRHAFLAAFAAFRGGRLDDARRRLDALLGTTGPVATVEEAPADPLAGGPTEGAAEAEAPITTADDERPPEAVVTPPPEARPKGRGPARVPYDVEARYWRARVCDWLDPAVAAEDRAWIAAHAADTWYGVLVRSQDPRLLPAERAARGAPVGRDGAWPRTPPPPAWLITPIDPLIGEDVPFVGAGMPLGWRLPGGLPERVDPALRPPAGYAASVAYDPRAAEATFAAFADAWRSRWPEVDTVGDLASAGLYDLSGPLFSDLYERIRQGSWRGDRTSAAAWRSTSDASWRAMFAFTRDHHHVARYSVGLASGVADPEERLRVEQLSMPVAHGRPVWRHAAKAGLDPYLVLGLMRAESTYNANAVSRVGARGPMQIMPKTGHLIADRIGDAGFTARSLHDPQVAVAYGIRYLGLLLDRFDGAWPLAVAAYNGGPHNVAAWLDGLGTGVEIDVFAESIPFNETRAYVRKVSVYYDDYLRIYEGGARVIVPPTARGDFPGVVDF